MRSVRPTRSSIERSSCWVMPADAARRRDLVDREPGVALALAAQRDDRLGALGGADQRDDAVDQAMGFGLGQHQAVRRLVLRMLTCLNRAGGQPWLTELICCGSPLPSESEPPSHHDLCPPIASHEFQNSSVLAW